MWGSRFVAALVLIAAPLAAQRKPGSPLANLPPNIRLLTHFGERADFSPDDRSVAFMAKSFGDAFTIDLRTRIIRCLTCSVPGAAFLRVMHLVSGDYVLIGPERFTDIRTSRGRDNELWYLSRRPGSRPMKFHHRMSEGAAISKTAMRIAFSETSTQNPDLPSGASRLITADVDVSGAEPRLLNEKVVHESPDRSCTIEAQDFYDDDTKLTFSCYRPGDKASVMSIDLKTGQVTDHSQSAGTYNEPEGILPGGKLTLVEADRHVYAWKEQGGHRPIDIYRLALDGSGKNLTRLTHFNDYEGWKASNPVVSRDGRLMAFQVARSADEAGVGYGILLYRFPVAKKPPE
jgi:hypothetical protein